MYCKICYCMEDIVVTFYSKYLLIYYQHITHYIIEDPKKIGGYVVFYIWVLWLRTLKKQTSRTRSIGMLPLSYKKAIFLVSNSFYMVRPTVTISDNYVTFQRKASLIAAPTLAAVCIEVNLWFGPVRLHVTRKRGRPSRSHPEAP